MFKTWEKDESIHKSDKLQAKKELRSAVEEKTWREKGDKGQKRRNIRKNLNASKNEWNQPDKVDFFGGEKEVVAAKCALSSILAQMVWKCGSWTKVERNYWHIRTKPYASTNDQQYSDYFSELLTQ